MVVAQEVIIFCCLNQSYNSIEDEFKRKAAQPCINTDGAVAPVVRGAIC